MLAGVETTCRVRNAAASRREEGLGGRRHVTPRDRHATGIPAPLSQRLPLTRPEEAARRALLGCFSIVVASTGDAPHPAGPLCRYRRVRGPRCGYSQPSRPCSCRFGTLGEPWTSYRLRRSPWRRDASDRPSQGRHYSRPRQRRLFRDSSCCCCSAQGRTEWITGKKRSERWRLRGAGSIIAVVLVGLRQPTDEVIVFSDMVSGRWQRPAPQ